MSERDKTHSPQPQMVGADHVDKARAWDAAQASFRKGYERGKAEAAALLAAIEADPDRTTAWPTDKAKLAWKKDVFEPALATFRSSLPSPQTRRDAFEVGDEVVCIDNSYPCGSLVIGQTYNVRHVGMTAIGCDSIGLVGIGNPGRADWHASRFRFATPPQPHMRGNDETALQAVIDEMQMQHGSANNIRQQARNIIKAYRAALEASNE